MSSSQVFFVGETESTSSAERVFPEKVRDIISSSHHIILVSLWCDQERVFC
jgi:hypothetical protein